MAEEPVQIGYASPVPSYGHKVGAGAAILLAGLGLVVLGGCFLIGVMLLTTGGFTNPTTPPKLSGSELILMYVLYGLAFISFLCALLVFLAGLRSLFRVMRA